MPGMPQLLVVETMEYLGIYLMRDPNEYISNNIIPLLTKFKSKIDIWHGLLLSAAGRCNLIKMLWMPQLLYLLHNSLVWIYKKWFKKNVNPV